MRAGYSTTSAAVRPVLFWQGSVIFHQRRRKRIDYGNGVRTTYEYDSRLRLKHLLTISKPTTVNQQLINFAYDLDGVSNLRSIEDLRPLSLIANDDARRIPNVFSTMISIDSPRFATTVQAIPSLPRT
jgi:hypothetical protein